MAEFHASHPLPDAEPTVEDVLSTMLDLVTRISSQAQHVGALSADLDRRPEVASQAKSRSASGW